MGNSPSSTLLSLGWGWSTRQTTLLGSTALWGRGMQAWEGVWSGLAPSRCHLHLTLAFGKAVQIRARPWPSASWGP